MHLHACENKRDKSPDVKSSENILTKLYKKNYNADKSCVKWFSSSLWFEYGILFVEQVLNYTLRTPN